MLILSGDEMRCTFILLFIPPAGFAASFPLLLTRTLAMEIFPTLSLLVVDVLLSGFPSECTFQDGGYMPRYTEKGMVPGVGFAGRVSCRTGAVI